MWSHYEKVSRRCGLMDEPRYTRVGGGTGSATTSTVGIHNVAKSRALTGAPPRPTLASVYCCKRVRRVVGFGPNDLTTDRGIPYGLACVPRPSPPSVNRQARGPSFVSTLMVATVSLPSRTARRAFRLEARRHADLPTCCFGSGTFASGWGSMAMCLASRSSTCCLALAVISPITGPPRPRPGG